MAELLAIVGESGSGKTTSVRNLNPEETFVISTTGKRPGIPGVKKKYVNFAVVDKKPTGNFYTASDSDSISKMLRVINSSMKHIKVVIIDD